MSRKNASLPEVYAVVFPTALGWMGLRMQGTKVASLQFGHRTRREVFDALEPCRIIPRPPLVVSRLVQRLTSYADGQSAVFSDVELAESAGCRQSEFARRVIAACRKIPAGQTRTYGQLAAAAGSPGAARAVGRCMATNPVPILVPCHRVVGSDGKLHGFSAPGGLAMKRRLLDLELQAAKDASR